MSNHRFGFLRLFVAVFSVLFLAGTPAGARGVREPSLAPEAPVPFDPAVRTGRLPNGVRYFVKRNLRPAGRAELRLVLDAGSVLEDDDQRGLAHFVEHLAFNGTADFPKHRLVHYLESIGMRFGPDTNAYTSFDETVYMLEVPLDREGALDTGLKILENWSARLLMDEEEIERERGVVLEEWRLGRGADARIRDKQFPTLLAGSRYAERLPIGLPEVIKRADREALWRYFRDWYRPDLTTVVAVGDFDPLDVERRIIAEFSDLELRTEPRPRPRFTVPTATTPRVSIVTDPELPYTSVAIYRLETARTVRTNADFRASLIADLFAAMANDRLDELTRRPGGPFLYGYAGRSPLVRSASAWVTAAVPREGEALGTLAALGTEWARVREHGFTQTELDRAKKSLLRRFEQRFRETDRLESGELASRLVAHAVREAPFAGPEHALALAQSILPGISPEEVSAVATGRGGLSEEGLVLLISAPDAAGLPSEEAALATYIAAVAAPTTPYVDDAPDGPILAAEPTAGRIRPVESANARDLGYTEWSLSNGARVLFKRTDFKQDEVQLLGYSMGGSAMVSDADYVSSQLAADIVEASGAGPWSRIQLERLLAGKSLSLEFSIDDFTESISARSSPRDLEALLQLLHLVVTSPRYDEAAVASYLEGLRETVRNKDRDPESLFADTAQVLLADGHFRSRPLSEAVLAELDPRRAVEIHRERFGNAADFTFVFVGNIEPDRLRPLVEKYLASLPSEPAAPREPVRDVGIRFPARAQRKTLEAGLEPKSLAAIWSSGPFPWSWKEGELFRLAMDYVDIRLRESVREGEGGTYSVSAYVQTQRRPYPQYAISISFGSSPERVEELVSLVRREMQGMASRPPSEEDLGKVKEAALRTHETALKENRTWIFRLRAVDIGLVTAAEVLAYPGFVAAVRPEDLQRILSDYWREDRITELVLKPSR